MRYACFENSYFDKLSTSIYFSKLLDFQNCACLELEHYGLTLITSEIPHQ